MQAGRPCRHWRHRFPPVSLARICAQGERVRKTETETETETETSAAASVSVMAALAALVIRLL